MKPNRPLLLIASVAALSVGALSAGAQEKPAPQSAPATETSIEKARRPERRSTLTDEQRQKLSALREQQREKIRAIRDDANLTPEQKRAKVRESFAAARDEASAVLTPEQKQQMKKFRHRAQAQRRHAMQARRHHAAAAWHQRHAGPGRHFGGPRHGQPGMFHRTAQPGPRFGAMGSGPGFQHGPRAGFGPQRGPAFGGGAPFAGLDLTDDQKSKLKELRSQHQEQMKESMKSFQEQMRSVLTPEQQEKLARRRR